MNVIFYLPLRKERERKNSSKVVTLGFIIELFTQYLFKLEMCGPLGRKGHIPPYNYAPDEIRKIKFLPLMKQSWTRL